MIINLYSLDTNIERYQIKVYYVRMTYLIFQRYCLVSFLKAMQLHSLWEKNIRVKSYFQKTFNIYRNHIPKTFNYTAFAVPLTNIYSITLCDRYPQSWSYFPSMLIFIRKYRKWKSIDSQWLKIKKYWMLFD